MTAARTLTDADVEAIADALARRLRPKPAAEPTPAHTLSKEEREAIQRKVRAKLRRRGVGFPP